MLVGFILFYFGIYFITHISFTEPSMFLLFIPAIYIAEIINDYFRWWYSPVDLPEDRKSLRFLVLELVFILLPVLLYYGIGGDSGSLMSIHAFISICILGLGFKYFALELNRFLVKNFSSQRTKTT